MKRTKQSRIVRQVVRDLALHEKIFDVNVDRRIVGNIYRLVEMRQHDVAAELTSQYEQINKRRAPPNPGACCVNYETKE